MRLILILALFAFSNVSFAQKTCRPFLLILTVGEPTVTFVNSCVPGEESVLSMAVSIGDKKVEVDSATFLSMDVNIKPAITKRIVEGISPRDANVIVNDIVPALKNDELVKAKLALIELVLTP
jgi:hypothetical protein